MRKTVTLLLARAGIIAALYAVLSFAVFPVASGAIQFRVSEALTLLPLLYAEAIPALFVGCIVVNLLTGCALYDVIFGSIVTLVAAILTYACGRIFKTKPLKIGIGGLFPVLMNAFLLPVIWYFCYGQSEYAYMLQAAFLLLGEGVSVYVLGIYPAVKLFALKEKGVRFLQ